MPTALWLGWRKSKTMKAQALYDLRQLTGYCSGTDLHDFFREQTGDPSPVWEVEIDEGVIPAEVKHPLSNLAAATNAMRKYGVSKDVIFQYELAWHGGANVETRLRHAASFKERLLVAR